MTDLAAPPTTAAGALAGGTATAEAERGVRRVRGPAGSAGLVRLPDQQPGGKFLIDEAVIEGRRNLFENISIKPEPQRRRESA